MNRLLLLFLLTPLVSGWFRCSRQHLSKKQRVIWCCPNVIDEEFVLILSDSPWFRLLYKYEEAFELRKLLDRCREGHTCPDYEVTTNTSNTECYHAVVKDLYSLCFDHNYFLKSFIAGPLVLKEYALLRQFHLALIKFTQSVITYRYQLEQGTVWGTYPGYPVTAVPEDTNATTEEPTPAYVTWHQRHL